MGMLYCTFKGSSALMSFFSQLLAVHFISRAASSTVSDDSAGVEAYSSLWISTFAMSQTESYLFSHCVPFTCMPLMAANLSATGTVLSMLVSYAFQLTPISSMRWSRNKGHSRELKKPCSKEPLTIGEHADMQKSTLPESTKVEQKSAHKNIYKVQSCS